MFLYLYSSRQFYTGIYCAICMLYGLVLYEYMLFYLCFVFVFLWAVLYKYPLYYFSHLLLSSLSKSGQLVLRSELE